MRKNKNKIAENKSTDEKVFLNGESYFESLLNDIDQAKTSIDLETYIFQIDKLGKKVLAHLESSAKRGVKIRLLVDGAGTPQWGGSLVKKLEKSGGETRIFHPFPWRLWQWSRSRVHASSILKAIYLLLKINSRNHRKTCVIDRNIAYIGSFNVDMRHLSKEQGGDNWRDTGIRLANLDLTSAEQAFESAWSHSQIQERIRQIFIQVHADPIIRLNNTRHRRRILYKNLLKRIKLCKSRIWITNAYFIPDNFLLRTLKNAANQGVDVKILLPKESDVLFIPWTSATFYENLLKSKIRIFEYLPSILHAKTLILDDWMSVGSSNLNHRSLLHDLEADVNISKPESKSILENQFIFDIEHSKEIGPKNLATHTLYQRIIGRLLLYVKYLI